MNYLFTTHPGYGHFNPTVPLGQGLLARGHQVVVASTRGFSSVIQSYGFETISAGLDWNESQLEETVPEIQEIPQTERGDWMPGVLFYNWLPKQLVPDLISAAKELRPDVIISGAYEPSGRIAAEILGIPFAGFGISIRGIESYIVDLINSLRSYFNLAQDPDLTHHQRYLELYFMPPSWGFESYRQEPVAHFIRPAGMPVDDTEVLPEWFGQLPKQPIVYASLGTVFNQYPQVFQAIIDSFRDKPVNLILTVGKNGRPGMFGKQPPNIQIEQFINQEILLPHVDICLNHGGFSTIMGALRYGRPLVLMPFSADQPAISQICFDHHVGVSLPQTVLQLNTSEYWVVNPSKINPAAIWSAVQTILDDPKYQTAALDMKRTIEAMPGMDHAIDLLEQLGITRKPIRNVQK